MGCNTHLERVVEHQQLDEHEVGPPRLRGVTPRRVRTQHGVYQRRDARRRHLHGVGLRAAAGAESRQLPVYRVALRLITVLEEARHSGGVGHLRGSPASRYYVPCVDLQLGVCK